MQGSYIILDVFTIINLNNEFLAQRMKSRITLFTTYNNMIFVIKEKEHPEVTLFTAII